MIAISEKPKIKIEINLDPDEKSEVLRQIRDFVMNLSTSYERGETVFNHAEPDPEFIPDEDQENPDLGIDDTEGPQVTEGDHPKDEMNGTEYVRLRDLLS